MRLLSPNAALLLSAFLNRSGNPQYGYELMQETGIKSGSLYPVLGRFEKLGWITGEMEELYDIESDPEELTNLALQRSHVATLFRFREQTLNELSRTGAKFVNNLPPVGTETIRNQMRGTATK